MTTILTTIAATPIALIGLAILRWTRGTWLLSNLNTEEPYEPMECLIDGKIVQAIDGEVIP